MERNRSRRWSLAKTAGFSLWTALVSLFLLWEATSYTGIMSLIGEWQFNAIGRHYPTFNYVVLVFLLLLPGYLVFMRPRRTAATERLESAMLRSARAFLRAATATAVALGTGMLVILVVLLLLPRTDGPRQVIDLSKPVPMALSEGPTTIAGRIVYERTAGFDEDMLIARRSFRFAPIVAPDGGGTDLRFFVQMPPEDELARSDSVPLSGVLKRNGLPGEVIRLFRYAGYQLEEPHYVLFLEPSAMRWPYFALLAQFLVGAILALIVGSVQWRRVRRLDHDTNGKVDVALV